MTRTFDQVRAIEKRSPDWRPMAPHERALAERAWHARAQGEQSR